MASNETLETAEDEPLPSVEGAVTEEEIALPPEVLPETEPEEVEEPRRAVPNTLKNATSYRGKGDKIKPNYAGGFLVFLMISGIVGWAIVLGWGGWTLFQHTLGG